MYKNKYTNLMSLKESIDTLKKFKDDNHAFLQHIVYHCMSDEFMVQEFDCEISDIHGCEFHRLEYNNDIEILDIVMWIHYTNFGSSMRYVNFMHFYIPIVKMMNPDKIKLWDLDYFWDA